MLYLYRAFHSKTSVRDQLQDQLLHGTIKIYCKASNFKKYQTIAFGSDKKHPDKAVNINRITRLRPKGTAEDWAEKMKNCHGL